MRLQVMVHGGPFDGTLTTIYAVDEVPTELRLADLKEEPGEETIQAHLYRIEGHNDAELTPRMVYASYSYVAPVVSRYGLVDVWIA